MDQQAGQSTLSTGEALVIKDFVAQQSPLLQLPREIRNQMYNYAYLFGGTYTYTTHPIYRTFPQPPEPIILTEDSTPTPSLVLVCRQLHHETEPFPLSRNNVSCTSLTVLSLLPTRLTFVQREQITSIRVHSAIEDSSDVAALVTLAEDRTCLQLLPNIRTVIIEVTRPNLELISLWGFIYRAMCNAKTLKRWLKKGREDGVKVIWEGKWWG